MITDFDVNNDAIQFDKVNLDRFIIRSFQEAGTLAQAEEITGVRSPGTLFYFHVSGNQLQHCASARLTVERLLAAPNSGNLPWEVLSWPGRG